jgi:RHS repeat-associated protein
MPSTPFRLCLQPISVAAVFSLVVSDAASAQGCCAGRSSSPAAVVQGGGGNAGHGSLISIFGGSPRSRRMTVFNDISGPNPNNLPAITVRHQRGDSFVDVAPGQKRVYDFNVSSAPGGLVPQLPGERIVPVTKSPSGAPASGRGETKTSSQDSKGESCDTKVVGTPPDDVEQPADPDPKTPNESLPATQPPESDPPGDPGNGGGPPPSGAPPQSNEDPRSGRGPAPAVIDQRDLGHGGAAIVPVAFSRSGATITTAAPGVQFALSLGASSADPDERAGFLLPFADAGDSTYDFEKITNYRLRGATNSVTTTEMLDYTPPLIYHDGSNGTIYLAQTSATVMTVMVYLPGSGSWGDPPSRQIVIERVTAGNPNPALYDTGCLITQSEPGKPTAISKRWWNAAINATFTSYNAYTSAHNSVVTTVSTVPNPTDFTRSVTTTTATSGSNADATTYTITGHTIETFLLRDGDTEVVTSSKVYLTSSLSGPFLETTYDYWPVDPTGVDANSGMLRREVNADGSWIVYGIGGAGESLELRPWKSTPPPPIAAIDTPAEIDTAIQTGTIYQGSIKSYFPTGQVYEDREFTAGFPISHVTHTLRGNAAANFAVGTTHRASASGDEYTTYRRNAPAPFAYRVGLIHRMKQNQPFDPNSTANEISRSGFRYRYASFSPTIGEFIEGSGDLLITDYIENINELPAMMHRSVTGRNSGRLYASEKYMVSALTLTGTEFTASAIDVLSRARNTYDDRGRLIATFENDRPTGSWTYTESATGSTVTNVDKHFTTWTYTYNLLGDLTSVLRHATGSLTFTNSPTNQWLPAQPAIDYRYKRFSVPYNSASYAALAQYRVELAESVPGVATRNVTATTFDGAGRVVISKDVLGLETCFIYTFDAMGSCERQFVGPFPINPDDSATITARRLQEEKRTRDGNVLSLIGVAPSVYYDYTIASFRQTTRFCRNSAFTSDGGLTETTSDGLGRVAASSQSVFVPNTSTFTQFTTAYSYDDQSRLVAVGQPGAPADFFARSVYSPFTPGSVATGAAIRTINSGRATTATGAPTANLRETRTYYLKQAGVWYAVGETLAGSPLAVEKSTKRVLGPWVYNGIGVPSNTAWWQETAGGRTATHSFWVQTPMTGSILGWHRDVIETAGTVRQTTSAYGRSALFEGPGVQRIATYSPLGDLLVEPSLENTAWPILTVANSTGLTTARRLPSDSMVEVTYGYYTGNDRRAGKVSTMTENKAGVSTGALPGTTYFDYDPAGRLYRQWGSGTVSLQYTYDANGSMTKMEAWRNSTTGNSVTWPAQTTAADVTEWTYAGTFEKPMSKIYMPTAVGTGEGVTRRTVSYKYERNGSLFSREWQRTDTGTGTVGITTFYVYDAWGRLATIDYPTNATANATLTGDVTYTYAPSGRLDTLTDGTGTTSYTYSPDGRATKETKVSTFPTATGPAADRTSIVERTLDSVGRIDLLKAKWGALSGFIAPDVDYGFPALGAGEQLNTVASAGRTVSFGFGAADRRQWSTATFATSATTVMTASRQTDSDGRIWSMSYSSGGLVQQSFNYTYDRYAVTKMVREQGSGTDETAWIYRYDAMGQVLSADKRFSTGGNPTGNFLAGYQTNYTFDRMGNRLTKVEGGSATATEGTGTRTTTYTPNALNQYNTVANPQSLDVTGTRASGQTIAVSVAPGSVTAPVYQNNASTGLQFSSVATHAHAGAGVGAYTALTVTTTPPLSTLDSGTLYVPPTSESPGYDADGNLRQDGRWAYQYDAENRLTIMTTRHPVSASFPGVRLTFTYDGLSRRIGKRVEQSTVAGTWNWVSTEAFLYDGWNMIMKVNYNNAATPAPTARQSFVWGPDIGSAPDGWATMQSAGGVGGLLMVLDQTAATVTSGNTGESHFPLMDRMGNITGYRRANTAAANVLSAVYEYDAFGREVKNTGPLGSVTPDLMPFRFSSKYTDNESGLCYYGYRFYDPVAGRWLNRDPIEEEGGVNLFGFVNNSSPNQYDVLGNFISNLISWLIPKPGLNEGCGVFNCVLIDTEETGCYTICVYECKIAAHGSEIGDTWTDRRGTHGKCEKFVEPTR